MRWITLFFQFTKRKLGWVRLKNCPGHSVMKWQSQDLNTGSLDAESMLFTMLFSLERTWIYAQIYRYNKTFCKGHLKVYQGLI